jgi:hypothetical protein
VHRGHAGAQRLGDAEPDADIGILRRHVLPEAGGDRENAQLADIRSDKGPQHADPQVPVGIDEARHADQAATVDHVSA